MKEVWKDIKGYEGYYRVSNMGVVKSIERTIKSTSVFGGKFIKKTQIMKLGLNSQGYYHASLNKNGKNKKIKVSLLVWDAFGDSPRDGRKLQVDHIDENKKNDNIKNLQLLNSRQNCSKGKKKYKKTSKFTGVHRKGKRWESTLYLNGRTKYLGTFDLEVSASRAYQNFVEGLKAG